MRKIGIEQPISNEVLKIAKNARRWALRENRGKSQGMCIETSQLIRAKLEKIGIKSKVRGWKFYLSDKKEDDYNSHYWVEINGKILDVTADQFNPIIREKPKMRAIVFHKKKALSNYYHSCDGACYS
jgi:hypothetical protein